MCGIAGIVGSMIHNREQKVQDMCNRMTHRGPDAGSVYSVDDLTLGHRRLSIIDLSEAANQPFIDKSERYAIVFNGEIYNYRELRSELSDIVWTSDSDTEVILEAYKRMGPEFLNKLHGMFAFAIWDRANKELFVARDRMGVKPFYYALKDGAFLFASEMRALLASGLIGATIHTRSLNEYLRFAYVKSPNTILEQIMQICPGHYGIFKDGKIEFTQYWSPITHVDAAQGNVHEDVRRLFDESVKERMVADVPVGAFLSGGIDSSAVVAAMSLQSSSPVRTFSVVFNEKEYDESEHARKIAEKYNCIHTELLLNPEELKSNLPEFIRALDHPSVDGINTFMVSGMVAATGIKVVLSGTGGDELFAGYNGFRRWKLYRRFLPIIRFRPLAKFGSMLLGSLPGREYQRVAELLGAPDPGLGSFYESSRSLFTLKELKGLILQEGENLQTCSDLNRIESSGLPVLSQYTVAELSQYTMEVLLQDTDQMSMAHALEVREPFFDHRMLAYVLSVDDAKKLDTKVPKSLFTRAMGDRLPDDIVFRPKKGFTFPWAVWMRGELSEYCSSALDSLSKRGILNSNGIRKLWSDFKADNAKVTWLQIWTLVVLEKWLQELENRDH